MAEQYLIGIDVGSSFTKATVFDTRGRVFGDAKHASHLTQPGPGVAEYDGRQLLQATYGAVRDAVEMSKVAPRDVAAICLDGMISGAMGIDAAGEPTTPYTTTLDMRFARQLNYVTDHFHALIREKTGSGQPTIAPKMMWIRDEFSDVYKKTAKFVTISGYILGKMAGLSGDDAFVDYTYLWATGLSDTRNYAWSDELCKALDLPMEKLPRIVQSSQIVGGLDRAAAEATGLLGGTPIVAGAGDQSVGFIGAGIVRQNHVADAAGTFPIIALCTDEFRPDLAHQMAEIIPSPIPNLWISISLVIGGGLTHHWFQETFGAADAVTADQRGGTTTVYDVLDEKASMLPPGSEKLFFIPHLGGQACPIRTNVKGMWMGFTWTHRREHFYRAVLEAIAYDQYVAFQSLQATYPEAQVSEIVVYGGGSRSSLWNQIKADVMGVPYVSLDREDLSAWGAAILAGHGVGIFDDIAETAERFTRPRQRFDPHPPKHALYRGYAEFYRQLVDGVAAVYDDLAALPDWTATA